MGTRAIQKHRIGKVFRKPNRTLRDKARVEKYAKQSTDYRLINRGVHSLLVINLLRGLEL